MATVNEVLAQMAENNCGGLEASRIVADGKIHRFVPDWEKNRRKERGWYIFFMLVSRSGESYISGSYGYWQGAENISHKVTLLAPRLSAAELAEMKAQQARIEQQAEKARAERHAAARRAANEVLKFCKNNGHSDYLSLKGVPSLGAAFPASSLLVVEHREPFRLEVIGGAERISDFFGIAEDDRPPFRYFKKDTMVLPLYKFTPDGVQVHGLQAIYPAGAKAFLTGTNKKGGWFYIPRADDADPCCPDVVGVVEGFATGATVHLALGIGVYVAFDAGNLKPVVEAVVAHNEKARVVIFGDDDKQNKINDGRVKALAAADAYGAGCVFPRFKMDDVAEEVAG